MAARAFLVLLLLVVGPRSADSCTCPAMPPCQSFWMADAVFAGVVTDVTTSRLGTYTYSHTTFIVERGFTGISGQVMVRGLTNSSCHYRFTVGQRYIVYALREADGVLTTGKCMSKAIAEGAADLDYAEHLPPAGIGGRIYGKVNVSTDILDARGPNHRFFDDVTITLQNPAGARLDLHPTGEGAFEAIGLKPDSYSVSVDVPGTTRAYGPTSIELEDRACAPIGVNVEATFSVRASLFVGQRQTASAEITMSLAEEPVSEVKLVLKPR